MTSWRMHGVIPWVGRGCPCAPAECPGHLTSTSTALYFYVGQAREVSCGRGAPRQVRIGCLCAPAECPGHLTSTSTALYFYVGQAREVSRGRGVFRASHLDLHCAILLVLVRSRSIATSSIVHSSTGTTADTN
ncbi:unnamed protein product [Prorocentrum cordatum]|uniref:Post-SET domain-containing protein n=1 Tax=Prorocentrum cordatum TaxID=2364126 RepID=A0ABN9RWB2_9DINO|nr:unnamed protein product [Polarella glacialis]